MTPGIRPLPRTAPSRSSVLLAQVQAHGNRRSAIYWKGCEDRLRFSLERVPFPAPPAQGTAEFDAYFSGVDRARDMLASLVRAEVTA